MTLTGCATYEGARDTATVSGVTFAASMAAFIAGDQVNSAPIAYSGIAVGTASMLVMMGSASGMVVLPRRVEIAVRLAHELVIAADSGDCATVERRRHEVEELDNLVYEVVLMDDPSVVQCYEPSSSPSSSRHAVPALPAPVSTSTVR